MTVLWLSPRPGDRARPGDLRAIGVPRDREEGRGTASTRLHKPRGRAPHAVGQGQENQAPADSFGVVEGKTARTHSWPYEQVASWEVVELLKGESALPEHRRACANSRWWGSGSLGVTPVRQSPSGPPRTLVRSGGESRAACSIEDDGGRTWQDTCHNFRATDCSGAQGDGWTFIAVTSTDPTRSRDCRSYAAVASAARRLRFGT